jgi:hypothetical protein
MWFYLRHWPDDGNLSLICDKTEYDRLAYVEMVMQIHPDLFSQTTSGN